MAAKKKTTNAPTEESPTIEAASLKKAPATKKSAAPTASSQKSKDQKTKDKSASPNTAAESNVSTENAAGRKDAKLATKKSPVAKSDSTSDSKSGETSKSRIKKTSPEESATSTNSVDDKNSATEKPSAIKKISTVKSSDRNEPPAIVVEPINDPDFIDFVALQKQRLLDLRDELVDAMTGSAREAIRNAPEGSEASGSGMHQGDAGSDAYDRDFALGLLAKEQDALYEIEEALQRIKKRTYGICEMSGKRIPIARLEAIPFARLTVDCQAQWEKEYGNRKFRPSGSVGFSGGVVYDDDEDSETVSLDDDDD